MKYEELQNFSNDEIEKMLLNGDIASLRLLSLAVCEKHNNFEYAQDICFQLLDNEVDCEIRANAILGLAYLARRFGKLDIDRAMPITKEELKRNKEWEGRITDAFDNIRIFLN